MHVDTHSVDGKQSARRRQTRAEDVMRKRSRKGIILGIVVVIAIIAIAFTIGSCVYRGSLSSNMSIEDSSVSGQLVAPASDQDVSYTLVAGIAHSNTQSETASYLSLVRVDPGNNKLSLVNIPNNIQVNVNDSTQCMLRDIPHVSDEGALVHAVASLTGIDVNHYVRIDDEGFVSLVDSLGGIDVNVAQAVDDPRVSHYVIDVGEQTLNGEQALTYVSARNYTNPQTTRASIQNQVLTALVDKMTSQGGLSSIASADQLSSLIQTDMNYDALSRFASIYANAQGIETVDMPGSSSVSGDQTYFYVNSSSWNALKDRFTNGQGLTEEVDTSGVDKSALTVVVLNGSGIDGFASEASAKLTSAGYNVTETGNAEQYVYDETLVIYREESDATAAEAVVADLGIGRAVSASVYYSLNSNIQVVVGKDWTPSG